MDFNKFIKDHDDPGYLIESAMKDMKESLDCFLEQRGVKPGGLDINLMFAFIMNHLARLSSNQEQIINMFRTIISSDAKHDPDSL